MYMLLILQILQIFFHTMSFMWEEVHEPSLMNNLRIRLSCQPFILTFYQEGTKQMFSHQWPAHQVTWMPLSQEPTQDCWSNPHCKTISKPCATSQWRKTWRWMAWISILTDWQGNWGTTSWWVLGAYGYPYEWYWRKAFWTLTVSHEGITEFTTFQC